MEEPSAMIEAMNKIAELIVTIAEGTDIAPLSLVQRDVMEDQSAMMEAMNKIVDPAPCPTVTTAEGIVTVPHQFVQSDVMEVQSATIGLMRKTAIQVKCTECFESNSKKCYSVHE